MQTLITINNIYEHFLLLDFVAIIKTILDNNNFWL